LISFLHRASTMTYLKRRYLQIWKSAICYRSNCSRRSLRPVVFRCSKQYIIIRVTKDTLSLKLNKKSKDWGKKWVIRKMSLLWRDKTWIVSNKTSIISSKNMKIWNWSIRQSSKNENIKLNSLHIRVGSNRIMEEYSPTNLK